jgi:DNA polymerase III delta prime subunit
VTCLLGAFQTRGLDRYMEQTSWFESTARTVVSLYHQEGSAMEFKKAVRKRAKLRLALSGPSGSGKTYSALLLANGLGGRIAVIDTEQGSASLYSHLCEYDTLELSPPYTPERFIEALKAAEKAKYDIVIIDSTTHEWSGSGGCLEINERLAGAKFKGNTWAAWNETTPRHRAFIDAMLQSPCHIIATMRSKVETVQEGGKVRKIGMKDEQREGTDYEFTIVLNLVHDSHYATASKDRSGLFSDPHLVGVETGQRLLRWLDSGASEVESKPSPKPADPIPTAESLSTKPAFGQAFMRTGASKSDFVAEFNDENGTNLNEQTLTWDVMTYEQRRWAAEWVVNELKLKHPQT